jgi:hypothetical protein
MPSVVDPVEHPVQFARENMVEALLCLADPERKTEHIQAAWLIVECVALAQIGAADELVKQHVKKEHGAQAAGDGAQAAGSGEHRG